ncbi:MAG: DNA repair protein RecO [Omnitrophica WOR_2 bacterium RIFCSPHIGHO2_02_FULL_67_20]|nr:MAG: DNA repair protein RecO [Omnitrophica WOR_2 bacterium RIFCSPHIGHO2_02_FULL_67_20]
MAIHTAEAIVLRRYPFRETSVTLSCLTDGYGKVKGLVKGLRAQPNRHRSAMEPCTVNRIVFYDTRTSQLHLVSQCELLDPLEGIQRDLDTARLAALCVELVDTVVPLEEPQPATYRLLKQTLERLALGGDEPQALRAYFIVRLLRLAGFQPQLDQCTGCGQPIHTSGYWSARAGGLLCPSCLHEDPNAEPARPELLEALETLSKSDQPPALDAGLLPGLRQRLDAFLHWRLDKPLKTLTA